MHTYRKSDQGFYNVGHWMDGGWSIVKGFEYEGEAAAYCCYLNGGEPPIRLLARLGLTSWEAEYKK